MLFLIYLCEKEDENCTAHAILNTKNKALRKLVNPLMRIEIIFEGMYVHTEF